MQLSQAGFLSSDAPAALRVARATSRVPSPAQPHRIVKTNRAIFSFQLRRKSLKTKRTTAPAYPVSQPSNRRFRTRSGVANGFKRMSAFYE